MFIHTDTLWKFYYITGANLTNSERGGLDTCPLARYIYTFLISLEFCTWIKCKISSEKKRWPRFPRPNPKSSLVMTNLWIKILVTPLLKYITFTAIADWYFHFFGNSTAWKQYWTWFKLKFPSIFPRYNYTWRFPFVLWGIITWSLVYSTLIFFNYFGPSDAIKNPIVYLSCHTAHIIKTEKSPYWKDITEKQ